MERRRANLNRLRTQMSIIDRINSVTTVAARSPFTIDAQAGDPLPSLQQLHEQLAARLKREAASKDALAAGIGQLRQQIKDFKAAVIVNLDAFDVALSALQNNEQSN